MTRDDNDHSNAEDGDIITTKSVNSTVFTTGDDRTGTEIHKADTFDNRETWKVNPSGQPMGHVRLFDWDGLAKRHATTRAGKMPGVTAVFRSSEGNHHAWNLTVSPLLQTVAALLDGEDDEAHVRAGMKRGYWRLRYTPKHYEHEDKTIYKSAPELVAVTVNRTDAPQSLPHMKLLSSTFDVPTPPGGLMWVGSGLSEEEYETMTDDAKARFTAPGEERNG